MTWQLGQFINRDHDIRIAGLGALAVDGAVERGAPQERKRLARRFARRALQQLHAQVVHYVAGEAAAGETAPHVLNKVLVMPDQGGEQILVIGIEGHRA